MSGESAASSAAQRAASGAGRIARAFRALPHERRLAAYGALGLFVTLFLPWYQETVIVPSASANLQAASVTLTGWGAFSFVEAALLLVAAGVLILLFQRAEGRAFHLPGGDGAVIMAAGGWTCVLVIWRIFDKQGTSSHGLFATTAGIEWGIIVALAVALFLTYAGSRIRAAHRPEPPLPGEVAPGDAPLPASGEARPAPFGSAAEGRRRRRPASLSAPDAAKPAPYGRGAKTRTGGFPQTPRPPQRRTPDPHDEPTLPQPAKPDPPDEPTLPKRRPGSLWQDDSPPPEADTEPKPAPDGQLTSPLDQ